MKKKRENKKTPRKKVEEKKKAKIKKEEPKKESKIEGEIEESYEEISIPQFFQQFPTIKFSPVLEKVARTQETNLEQQISNVQVRKDEEQRIVRYGGEKSDYETAKLDERRTPFKYSEAPKYDPLVKDEKKETVVPFGKMRQEWENKERRRTMTEMEMAGFEEIHNENKGKKYLAKGRY